MKKGNSSFATINFAYIDLKCYVSPVANIVTGYNNVTIINLKLELKYLKAYVPFANSLIPFEFYSFKAC